MKRLLNGRPRHLVVLLPVAALALLLLGTPATPSQPDKGVKLPEPDKAALDKSEKILTKMFKEELAKAKTDGAAARELAELLLKEARLTNEDAPLRFIALVYARDLAAQAGDTRTGMAAIEELAKHYTVDTLGMKTKMIGLAADKATSKDDHVGIVELALSLLEEAVAGDNYKIADDLVKAAEESAAKTKNLQIVGRVNKRTEEVEQAKKEFGRMQKFVDILANKADDPTANAEMGKYLSLVKGNWEKGLPMLAKGNDKAFVELAKRDLANPKETRAQIDLADEYDNLAENVKGLANKMLLKRAMHWYVKCLPHLEGGLNKVRVEKKIEEIAKLFPSAPGITVVASGGPITTLVRVFDQHHLNGVLMLAMSQDSKMVVSCGSDENLVRLWNVSDGKQIRQMAGHNGFVFAVAMSPDGSQVASASQDGSVKTWDTKTGNILRNLNNHGDWVWGVYYFPDKNRLLTVCDDKVLRIFELSSGKVLKDMRGHTQYIPYMSASKDGKRAATASNDGTVRVWDLDQGSEITKFLVQQPMAVAISPDGKKVVTASQIGMSVKVWDVNAKNEIRSLTVPAPAKSIAFSPDGKTIAIGTGGIVNNPPAVAIEGGWPLPGANDNSIYFFEADTGKAIRRLTGHTGWVRALAYSADGRYLVSGGSDRTIRLWGEGKK